MHAGLPADRRSHVLPQVARSNSEVDHDVEQALKRIIAGLRGARDITRKRLPIGPMREGRRRRPTLPGAHYHDAIGLAADAQRRKWPATSPASYPASLGSC